MEENFTITKEQIDSMIMESLAQHLPVSHKYVKFPELHTSELKLVHDENGESFRAPLVHVDDLKALIPLMDELLGNILNVYRDEMKFHNKLEAKYDGSHKNTNYDMYVDIIEKMVIDLDKVRQDAEKMISKNISARVEYMRVASRIGHKKYLKHHH